MTGMTAQLRYSWPSEAMQTEALRPRGSHAVLLAWRTGDDAVESGVPRRLAEAIAAALVGIGCVAFRWSGDCRSPAEQAQLVKASTAGVVRSAIERLTGRWSSDVVLTREALVAVEMFDHDWELQGQAALVFDAGRDFLETVRSDLAVRRDWRDFEFVYPALVFLAPAVDGDGVLFAAGSERDLEKMIMALHASLAEAGISVYEDNAERRGRAVKAEVGVDR